MQITRLGSDLSLTQITIIAPVMPRLQRTRGWSHEVTRNGMNTKKMTDIANDVFRCTYTTIDVSQTQDTK